jgi:hypothetical protein
MLDDTKKTHTEVKHPQISIPRLADYMAASKQSGSQAVMNLLDRMAEMQRALVEH